jgi:hypothetical protein
VLEVKQVWMKMMRLIKRCLTVEIIQNKQQVIRRIKNVYVVLSEDEVFLTDYLTQMNMFADKKDIQMIGVKKWISINHIDSEYLNKLGYTYPTPYFIDSKNINVINLSAAYRKKYYTDPSDYYFQGFDVGYYYLNALKTMGPDFVKQLEVLKSKGLIMDFNFYRPSDATGFDNKSLYIIKYKDYLFQKVN